MKRIDYLLLVTAWPLTARGSDAPTLLADRLTVGVDVGSILDGIAHLVQAGGEYWEHIANAINKVEPTAERVVRNAQNEYRLNRLKALNTTLTDLRDDNSIVIGDLGAYAAHPDPSSWPAIRRRLQENIRRTRAAIQEAHDTTSSWSSEPDAGYDQLIFAIERGNRYVTALSDAPAPRTPQELRHLNHVVTELKAANREAADAQNALRHYVHKVFPWAT